ncbi:SRPBCC domain-containing protein [uncultured Brevundimonas sp.]|uniref:SRPBCC domain-containing protein n=1 Tax=uncultured Brevundimonas sp. TaxID=213418 RepID=UPI002610333C|nr:SRPBCC domain-containing protein [uncultured Brevundimonas sp.]
MDSTRIENRIGIRASAEHIWQFIEEFDHWSRWNPYEQNTVGAIGFNAPLSYEESWPSVGPRTASASVSDWVPAGKLVWAEKRGFLFTTSRFITLEEVEKGATIVTNGIIFGGLRGEMFHDKHRAKFRAALTEINEKLKAVSES